MPENSYTLHEKHYVAVDCVIFGYEKEELKVLLYRRGFEPFCRQMVTPWWFCRIK